MHTDLRPPSSQRRTRLHPAETLRTALLELADGHARVEHHSEKSWASITFAGARHKLELAFEGEQAVAAGENFIAFLPEHEFAIRGHLVADAAITEVDHRLAPPLLRVRCELLLLEES